MIKRFVDVPHHAHFENVSVINVLFVFQFIIKPVDKSAPNFMFLSSRLKMNKLVSSNGHCYIRRLVLKAMLVLET